MAKHEGTLSLKDLEKENEEEAKQTPDEDKPDEDQEDPDTGQPDADENDDSDGDSSDEDSDSDEGTTDQDDEGDADADEDESGEKDKKDDQPDWMKGDVDEDADEETVHSGLSDSEAAKIRRKYKSQLREEKERNASLEKRIEELESGKIESKAENEQRPKRDDFDSEDDYFDALADFRYQQRSAQDQSSAIAKHRKEQAIKEVEKRNERVLDHYTRAVTLSKKSGIKAESYQAADMRVREAVEAVFPEAGDEVTEHMISLVGEGSEKVFYHLGVNAKKREEFVRKLQEDGTGLAAAAYLGSLNAALNATGKRTSKAPDPGAELQGDKQGKSGERSMKKQYDDAHKAGDTQKAFKLKRQAKKKGYNTRTWAQ